MRRGVKIIVTVLLLLVAVLVYLVARQGGDMARLSYSPLDISQVGDGVYRGAAETLLVAADVEVTIQNGILRSVHITRHQNGLGKAAETITDTMVAQNTLDVDAVSGATVSSKVIQSAVYNALTK